MLIAVALAAAAVVEFELFHLAMFFLCRTQNQAMSPPAQQRKSKITTTMIATMATDNGPAVVFELELLVLLLVPVLPKADVLEEPESDKSAAFQPVIVAEAGTRDTWAVAVPSSTFAIFAWTVIQVDIESVPHP